MKKFLVIISTVVLTLSMMPSAFAVTLKAADNVTISKNMLDDAYIFGGNVVIDADIFGDLHVFGGSVTVNGKVSEDLIVGGGRVEVTNKGVVDGDVRVLGGVVNLYNAIGDDLLVAGGQVDVGPGAVIGGSLLSGAGVLTLDGEVKEDLRGGFGMLILNGKVGQDVVVTVEDNMSISESASIGGNLKYSALFEYKVPENVVQGETVFNLFEREKDLEKVTHANYVYEGIMFLGSVLLALLFVLLMPKLMIRSTEIVKENLLKTWGMGILTIIILFIGALVLMATLVGIPISLIAFSILLIIFYVAKIFVAAWGASYVTNFKKKNYLRARFFGFMVLSLLVYTLIAKIPYLGWLLKFILFFFGVGAITLLKIEYYKYLKKKKMV